MDKMRLTITSDDFDTGQEIEWLKRQGTGALVSFIGIVRDVHSNPELISLTLEHYPGMTEHEIQNIINDAEQRWPLTAVSVIHRIGTLAPQDNIVFVGTSSAHRQAAFESAQFIMDYLKTRAPFWKFEQTHSGGKWVDAREQDENELRKWTPT